MSPELCSGLLFWGIIGGIIGAVINQSKGWDGVVGFFGGFLLGPIFVWLFLLQEDSKKGMGLKKCPYCDEWVKRKASVCRYCHKEMPPAIPRAAYMEPPMQVIPVVSVRLPPQAIPVTSIRFPCESCNQILVAPVEKAGVETICRFCKQPVTIPVIADAAEN